MKTPSVLLLFFLPWVVWAHPGHPGPAEHGDATHALLGLALALPALGGALWILRRLKLHQAAKAISRGK